jgi:hypothetical protein
MFPISSSPSTPRVNLDLHARRAGSPRSLRHSSGVAGGKRTFQFRSTQREKASESDQLDVDTASSLSRSVKSRRPQPGRTQGPTQSFGRFGNRLSCRRRDAVGDPCRRRISFPGRPGAPGTRIIYKGVGLERRDIRCSQALAERRRYGAFLNPPISQSLSFCSLDGACSTTKSFSLLAPSA